MPDRTAYLFVHIPKTAGTSFRLAAERYFGSDRVIYDYGLTAPESTRALLPLAYPRVSDDLDDRLGQMGVAMLAGHFDYQRYSAHFSPERTIAFVRDPIERVISEYHHSVRLHGFTGALLDFARIPRNQNLQSRCLRGADLERLALLGVSSRYETSLKVLAARTGHIIDSIVANVNPEQPEASKPYSVDPDIRGELEQLNRQDRALFDRAEALLSRRERAELTPSEPTIGWLDRYDGDFVSGWAARPGVADAVNVAIYVDGRLASTVVADAPRLDLLRKGRHPTGNAGFRVSLGTLAPGTIIRCRTLPDGGELSGSPLTIAKRPVPPSESPLSED